LQIVLPHDREPTPQSTSISRWRDKGPVFMRLVTLVSTATPLCQAGPESTEAHPSRFLSGLGTPPTPDWLRPGRQCARVMA
jgi:hypothetical protein